MIKKLFGAENFIGLKRQIRSSLKFARLLDNALSFSTTHKPEQMVLSRKNLKGNIKLE